MSRRGAPTRRALLGAAWLAALLAAGPAAASEYSPQGCQGVLAATEFANRFRVLGAITELTACRVKELVEEADFRTRLAPRIQHYLERCYPTEERDSLRQIIRRGVLQAMPYAAAESCGEASRRLLALPEPPR